MKHPKKVAAQAKPSAKPSAKPKSKQSSDDENDENQADNDDDREGIAKAKPSRKADRKHNLSNVAKFNEEQKYAAALIGANRLLQKTGRPLLTQQMRESLAEDFVSGRNGLLGDEEEWDIGNVFDDRTGGVLLSEDFKDAVENRTVDFQLVPGYGGGSHPGGSSSSSSSSSSHPLIQSFASLAQSATFLMNQHKPPSPQLYSTPQMPPAAADAEDNSVDAAALEWASSNVMQAYLDATSTDQGPPSEWARLQVILDGPPCANQKTLIKTIKRLKASQPDIEAGKLVRVLSQFARELK